MKEKKFHKKLVLNKKTVADLSDSQMSRLKGGLPYTYDCWGTLGECNSNYTVCDCPVYTQTYTCCVTDQDPTACMGTEVPRFCA